MMDSESGPHTAHLSHLENLNEAGHYVVTAHQPGAVVQSVKCSFLAPGSVVSYLISFNEEQRVSPRMTMLLYSVMQVQLQEQYVSNSGSHHFSHINIIGRGHRKEPSLGSKAAYKL